MIPYAYASYVYSDTCERRRIYVCFIGLFASKATKFVVVVCHILTITFITHKVMFYQRFTCSGFADFTSSFSFIANASDFKIYAALWLEFFSHLLSVVKKSLKELRMMNRIKKIMIMFHSPTFVHYILSTKKVLSYIKIIPFVCSSPYNHHRNWRWYKRMKERKKWRKCLQFERGCKI